jgi:NhaP-type Na+/H+ or K+/H+ antiporter
MTSAYASAASDVTPRASRILMSDTVAQNVLDEVLNALLFLLIGFEVVAIAFHLSNIVAALIAIPIYRSQ